MQCWGRAQWQARPSQVYPLFTLGKWKNPCLQLLWNTPACCQPLHPTVPRAPTASSCPPVSLYPEPSSLCSAIVLQLARLSRVPAQLEMSHLLFAPIFFLMCGCSAQSWAMALVVWSPVTVSWDTWTNVYSRQLGQQWQTKAKIPRRSSLANLLVYCLQKSRRFQGGCITAKPISEWQITQESYIHPCVVPCAMSRQRSWTVSVHWGVAL